MLKIHTILFVFVWCGHDGVLAQKVHIKRAEITSTGDRRARCSRMWPSRERG